MSWLLSAYAAASHRAWATWLCADQSERAWHCLELPGRHFAWRIRGNPLSWLDLLPAGTPDLIVATSMVDLATLKGLHPRLARVPSVYYFHENQFAYPRQPGQVRTLEPQMVQLYGALAADRVLFNSRYNRATFLAGVDDLLAQFPDAVPTGVRDRLERRSAVLPVPIEPVAALARDPRLILWNHRWEYDKAPEVFARALLDLAARGVTFRVALLGARPTPAPPALGELRATLGSRIVADGHLDRAAYLGLLGRAGIAVSTARHEFQGLAMLEAVSAGARPLVPDALCYPEQYPDACRYPPGDVHALSARLERWLDGEPPPPVDVSAWFAGQLRDTWRQALKAATA